MNKIVIINKEDRDNIAGYIVDAQEMNRELTRLYNLSEYNINYDHWRGGVANACAAINIALNLGPSDTLRPHIRTIVDNIYEFGLTKETGEHIVEYYMLDDKAREDLDVIGNARVFYEEMISREQSMEFVRAAKKFCTRRVGIKKEEYDAQRSM